LIVNFALSFRACSWPCSTLPFRLGGSLMYSLLRKMPDQVAEKGLGYKHRSSLRRSSSVSLVSLVSPQTAMPRKSMHLRQSSRAMRTVDPHCGHTTGSSCRYMETEMLFIRNPRETGGTKRGEDRPKIEHLSALTSRLPLPLSYYGKPGTKFLTTQSRIRISPERKHARPCA
jgi:hypothetical protein